MSDGAPVCNLPNLSQVPALQPGRNFPTIPRANDLPSLIQAINALAQVVNQLTSPGLPPFRNNLAPLTSTSRRFVGTTGIIGTQGADRTSGQAGTDGKDGKEGQKITNPNWHESSRKTERVKVVRPKEENDPDTFVIMKRVTRLVLVARKKGHLEIRPAFQQQDGLLSGGPVLQAVAIRVAGAGAGRTKIGTLKFDRTHGEEDTAFPNTGTAGEGTRDRPFSTGLMQDCIGVQWGGGGIFTLGVGGGPFAVGSHVDSFAIGDKNCFVATTTVNTAEEKKNPKWIALSSGAFGDGGVTWASSYHNTASEGDTPKPVFVLGGRTAGSASESQFGIIMASKDGKHFSEVLKIGTETGGNISADTMISGIVWDQNAFWASANEHISNITSSDPFVVQITKNDILLTSLDGFHWSEVNRVTVVEPPDVFADDFPLPTRGLLVDHCHQQFIDRNGNASPDGIVGADEKQNRFMAPTDLPAVDYLHGGVKPGRGSSVTIVDKDGTRSVDIGIPFVQGVAHAGGKIWMAVGGAKIDLVPLDILQPDSPPMAAISLDNGETWNRCDPPPHPGEGPFYAITVCGAPKADLKSD